MKNSFLPFLIALFIAAAFLSCNSEKEKDRKEKFKAISGRGTWEKKGTIDKKEKKKKILFGITPFAEVDVLKRAYGPFVRYLASVTGNDIELYISENYTSLKNDLKEGRVNIATFPPAAYADALKSIPKNMEYIATMLYSDNTGIRDFYEGFIVVRKDSKVTSVKELKDKSFGFVSKGSASGYNFPVALLFKRKINHNRYFSNTFFLGTHDKVTDALAEKKIDAGATWDGNYDQAVKKHGDIFKIILKTPKIANDALVVTPSMDRDFKRKIQNIIVSLKPDAKDSEGAPIFPEHKFLAGFTKRDDNFYLGVVELFDLVKKVEKKNKK